MLRAYIVLARKYAVCIENKISICKLTVKKFEIELIGSLN